MWVAWPADWRAVRHVPNFDQVNASVYRGGQPGEPGLLELGAFGIKRIVDLRESGKATENERTVLSKLGIKYINLPMSGFAAPSEQQIEKALAILNDEGPSPTFVHCRRGKDRTGTVIACYRIQHDHWSNQQALNEAKEHGMGSWEWGMQGFISRFRTGATARLSPLSPPSLGTEH